MRKLRLWFLGVMLAVFAQSAWTEGATLRKDHPEEYTVKQGDTLWGISSRFLEKPWYWPEIWHVNPQVENPHLIYPGDRLYLTWKDGRPVLSRDRGTIKLSPKVRVIPLDLAIPAIPLDSINQFLVNNRIVDEEVLAGAPYVIAGRDGHVVTGMNDVVYARGALSKEVGTYGIYRAGEAYKDPDTGEFLGLEATDIGLAKVLATEGDIATMEITSSRSDVRIQDRLLGIEQNKVTSLFHPSAPDSELTGKILSVVSGVSQVAANNVVAINLGARNGLQAGNVMAIYKAGGIARDDLRNDVVQLPAERAGLLMVFRTFEKMSYALVLRASRPLEILDEVRNP